MPISQDALRERQRCVTICRRRAELWTATQARTTVRAAQDEARARANEATYLADLIERGQDVGDNPPSAPGIQLESLA